MKATIWMTLTTVGLVSTVAAQNPPVVQRVEPRAALEQLAQTAEVRSRNFVHARITKGAPYSADTTTESVQVLGDGNRIARKTTTRVFRDAEGRTRVEQVGANGEVETVNISDPVSDATFVLNPQKRTAYKNGSVIVMPQGSASTSVSPGGRGTVTVTQAADGRLIEGWYNGSVEAGAGGRGARSGEPPTAAAGGFGGGGGGRGGRGRGTGAGAPVREDLGQQVIEGVMATGSRSTTVIAAGAIGNDQPIRIVSEQWFSDDLKVLVLTKHSDPRVGETIFRLTNISRADPAASLFVVPSDYTLEQSYIRRER